LTDGEQREVTSVQGGNVRRTRIPEELGSILGSALYALISLSLLSTGWDGVIVSTAWD